MDENLQTQEQEQKEKKKIMLVDDVKYSLISFKERLKDKYDLFLAQKEEEVFKILESAKLDLILLDVNMPEADGYQIIKKLKANDRFKDIPVIFLSGNNDRKSIITGMTLGAVDYITKPISTPDLIDRIEFQFYPERQEANRPVILAVDDSTSILNSIAYILNDKYTVRTLSKPELLRDLLTKVTPDLFLLDYNMPGINGFELIPIIRKIYEHEETPIMFLTTEGTIDHINVAITSGACDYMVKPINDEILKTKIAHHLKHYVMRRLIRKL